MDTDRQCSGGPLSAIISIRVADHQLNLPIAGCFIETSRDLDTAL